MRSLVDALIHVHPSADIRLYFSTPTAEPWHASCHAQHLHVVRMVLDGATYAETFRTSADLDSVIEALAKAVSPMPVNHCSLKATSPRRLGPFDPLPDLLDANRSHAGLSALKAAKRAILSAVQGEERR
ncbi:hypothetical protein [Sedimentitalea todarodis]|uniref:Uncharacterized protein n=1 Tax=Sedimentitalea todarodis TaxID=1631240 RepID=A0ABU3V883_9RHOB|nr:hypothetical protein [Sedimentitalea todarodis]MDU9002386.1 hypothetical protein [Sedimentitalea todarodis]